MVVTFDIQVKDHKTARVKSRVINKLKKNVDKIQFTSNDPTTVLRFGAKTPFSGPEFGKDQILHVGTEGAGPFPVSVDVIKGKNKFVIECGFLNPATGDFAAWGDTKGVVVPDGDRGL
jgi:hypothetical protein